MGQFFKNLITTIIAIFISFGILTVILFISLIAIAGVSSSEKAFKPKSNSVLKLELSGEIVEHAPSNPWADLDLELPSPFNVNHTPIGMSNILRAIESAKNDPNIHGISLEVGMLSAGLGIIEEIRNALNDFKESGKFVTAYGDFYSLNSYYLASCADKVFLAPSGVIHFKGISIEKTYYKNLFDKLDIEMQIVRTGKYKSYGESFSRSSASEESKQQTMEWMKDLWAAIKTDVATSRNITQEQVEKCAETLMLFESKEHILHSGLIDSFMYRNEYETYIKQQLGNQVSKVNYLSLNNALNIKQENGTNSNSIAILYAQGSIAPNENINAKTLTKEINRLADDKKVKAIVFRVNSPGGSAFESEQIWQALSQARLKKPVIASMSDVAASGGYYISCGSDSIVAYNKTITGSIGVIGMLPKLEGAFEKIGITYENISTHAYADAPNPMRGYNEAELQHFQNFVNESYQLFLQRCADARGKEKEYIHQYAQGRVWSGEYAKKIGLVDELGGLQKAIEIAANKAGVYDYTLAHYPEAKNFLESIINANMNQVQKALLKNVFGEYGHHWQALQEVKELKGVQARLPFIYRLY